MSKSSGDYLGRDEILDANDVKTEPVEVPEWGGQVLVKGLSGEERAEFSEKNVVQDESAPDGVRVREKDSVELLVALCCVDEQGEKLFSPDDVAKLRKKSAKALGRVTDKARELSGLGEEDLEEAKKNSE